MNDIGKITNEDIQRLIEAEIARRVMVATAPKRRRRRLSVPGCVYTMTKRNGKTFWYVRFTFPDGVRHSEAAQFGDRRAVTEDEAISYLERRYHEEFGPPLDAEYSDEQIPCSGACGFSWGGPHASFAVNWRFRKPSSDKQHQCPYCGVVVCSDCGACNTGSPVKRSGKRNREWHKRQRRAKLHGEPACPADGIVKIDTYFMAPRSYDTQEEMIRAMERLGPVSGHWRWRRRGGS